MAMYLRLEVVRAALGGALAAAARTEDLRPPTAASLKSGHAIGKGASFGSHVCV